MKPLLVLPLLAALTSCSAFTTPIYLQGEAPAPSTESTAETPLTAPATQTKPTTRARTTDLPETIPPRKTISQVRGTGNFVQPNVLGIPKKEDLKETATTTETAPPPPSVTVPAAE